ncbi:hypothetical protein IKE_05637 [Bacillus cereus VD196]|uniref:Uncharacterized protein n=1 Tax=Bacillus cereus VD196 TaxID=1053243 RepID=A0A9W5PYX2_BACCE|nr:hypothetical protein [Bacillus cereus]EJR90780.1 hypothetical protein IKG_05902 [Bacillus cereus VD200]EOO62492.1 hypothetical protein IKE_05637 [Bacillus cereus VD196]
MEKYPVKFTIISPNGEVYEPNLVYVTANSPDAAIQQVENEIENRMGKHYKYKVKISMSTNNEQLSLF